MKKTSILGLMICIGLLSTTGNLLAQETSGPTTTIRSENNYIRYTTNIQAGLNHFTQNYNINTKSLGWRLISDNHATGLTYHSIEEGDEGTQINYSLIYSNRSIPKTTTLYFPASLQDGFNGEDIDAVLKGHSKPLW